MKNKVHGEGTNDGATKEMDGSEFGRDPYGRCPPTQVPRTKEEDWNASVLSNLVGVSEGVVDQELGLDSLAHLPFRALGPSG